jgi:hypothetical protein
MVEAKMESATDVKKLKVSTVRDMVTKMSG